ncbi:hypothetical protein LJR234_004631 [Mesorhizobium amorphae]|uniref:hypothetical protein n=1 Tax=Mesorhizobium amorphae TaxID=71433 RepID=UPI003ED0DF81
MNVRNAGKLLAFIGLLIFCFAEQTAAQSALSNACTVLAGRITPDVTSQTSLDKRYSFFQQIVSQDTFRSFDTAKASTLDIGISVLSYVDATLGTTSDASTWETNWTKFKSSTLAESNTAFSTSFLDQHWNVDVVKAILANCPGAPFFGVLTDVTDGNDAFTILLHGTGQWQLSQISIRPKDSEFECDGAETASVAAPKEFTNEIFLTCSKSPDKTALITIRSTQGSAGPFKIKSSEQTISDNVSALRASTEGLQAKLNALQAQHDALKSSYDTSTTSTADAMSRALNGLGTYGGDEVQGRLDTKSTCPNGQYAVGITGKSVAGGNNGYLESHAIICRALNIVK